MGTAIGKRLLITLACIACLPSPVRAEVPAAAVTQSKDAAKKTSDLVAKTREKGDMPRLVVPAEAAVLEAFWDAKTMFGAGPYRGDDIPALTGIFEPRADIFDKYINFTSAEGRAADPDRNLSVFQDEIARSMEFLLRGLGALAPSMADLVGKKKASQLPAKAREGIHTFRSGWLDVMKGGTAMLLHPGMKRDNQMLVVSAFAENADAIAGNMTMKDRTAMAEDVRAVLPNLDSQLRNRMQVFVDALSSQGCERLCKIE